LKTVWSSDRVYELVYRSGGHGGPYDNHPSAVYAAMRYLHGYKYIDDTVIVTPRWIASDALLPVDRRSILDGTLDAVQIIKAEHVCSCNACPARGEIFYHVRIIKVRPF
jgi:hypothetical protein